jgi:hypothetical protein
LVEEALSYLRSAGCETIAEYTFNHYGVSGFGGYRRVAAASRTLLIVEIKTRFVDVQELFGTLDRKCRVVPLLLARERGWEAASVGRLVVAAEHSAARRVGAEHAITFGSMLPQRGHEVRRWLADPHGPFAGLWFLSSTTGGRSNETRSTVQRVRRSRPRSRRRGDSVTYDSQS